VSLSSTDLPFTPPSASLTVILGHFPSPAVPISTAAPAASTHRHPRQHQCQHEQQGASADSVDGDCADATTEGGDSADECSSLSSGVSVEADVAEPVDAEAPQPRATSHREYESDFEDDHGKGEVDGVAPIDGSQRNASSAVRPRLRFGLSLAPYLVLSHAGIVTPFFSQRPTHPNSAAS